MTKFTKGYVHRIYNMCISGNQDEAANDLAIDKKRYTIHNSYMYIPKLLDALIDVVSSIPRDPTANDLKVFAMKIFPLQEIALGGLLEAYDGKHVIEI